MLPGGSATTTITLEVPDDLARRLNAERDRLPQALDTALKLLPPRRAVSAPAAIAPALVFTEMIEFLSNRPTVEQILSKRKPGPPLLGKAPCPQSYPPNCANRWSNGRLAVANTASSIRRMFPLLIIKGRYPPG
jgi:hypothetical protein